MTGYMDLSERELENLFYFIDKAGGNHFSALKERYTDLKLGGTLQSQRDKVLHALMMNEINFEYFITWLNHVQMHGNNTIYIFEPEVKSVLLKNPINSLNKKIQKSAQGILKTNVENLKEIRILHSSLDLVREQIIITIAAPAYLSLKDEDNNPYLSKDIYLAYLIIDYKLNHFVLSLHPTHTIHSVNNIIKDKNFDSIALMLMDYFRKNFLAFNYANPDWILDGMAVIVEEYFDHNNPIITKKLSDFKEFDMPALVERLTSKESAFQKESFQRRFERALLQSYESELIEVYKQVPTEKPFSIFLHEAGKGMVSFMANSNGKPLNYADSRMIVKMMMENTLVSSLGITYSENGKAYPYKISKSYNFISLKRVNNSGTPKEIVDNVLSNLNKYKSVGELECRNQQVEDIE